MKRAPSDVPSSRALQNACIGASRILRRSRAATKRRWRECERSGTISARGSRHGATKSARRAPDNRLKRNSVPTREQSRLFRRKKIAERLLGNSDVRPDVNEVVELDHIFRAHANAAVTGAPSDAPFFGGAMNV